VKRIFILMPLVVFLGVALVFGGRLMYHRANGHPSVLKDKPAPTASFEGFNNGTGLGSEDLKGQVTVVNIFASWCPPCIEEHPQITTLSKSVKVIGINYKDLDVKANAFLQKNGNPYAKIVADPKGRNAIEWGVYGIPETFILDKAGIIRFKFIGPISEKALNQIILPQIKAAGEF
jgi:cytochrome c biogenesis protein CcmG, thiol:disulfide interchange protein DsbE